ncbi:response regulator transcription factor [uncultured Cohaesibacter sp.]|uniref:response regulator transcription factor n=1 Tax=uncultured Cohaesibacter sp. TaxID=1002546 RepID=UPI00292D5A57|nr:response regulator transcription factor [uncultured Cohaesibacter sp.]
MIDMASERTGDAFAAAHLVVVEDDPGIAQLLAELLSENGYSVSLAASSIELDNLLNRGRVDLILLDIMLPGEDGFSICRRVRTTRKTPILMLTAMGEDTDRVVGLELGADDYVTKPFKSRELVARVKSLLRRASYNNPHQVTQSVLSFLGWRLEPNTRQLYDPDGVEITLTTAEFDLLLAFCQHSGQVMTRKKLLTLTHAGSAGPVPRSIDVHVSRLRQKLEPDAKEPKLIKTVRLGGYLFTPTITRL